MKRNALGKGLSALLPDPDSAKDQASPTPQEVAIDRLDPNPAQPRLTIDPAALAELASSIRESGMVQPIVVRPHGNRFQIIAGERRWRAAQQVGLARVPVHIRDVPDDRLLELALIENIQRQELMPLEEAQAYQRLQEMLHLTQEAVARRVGKERSTVANSLRLLRLPREVRELLTQGRLDGGHARALLALEKESDQILLARETVRKRLSVREVERRVQEMKEPRPRSNRRPDPNTRAAEERLKAVLGTKVEIRRKGRGGRLQIAFNNESELNRLFELLVRAPRSRG